MQDCFLSCDWGTSNFRLRLVQMQGLKVLAEEVNETGIAEMHKRWIAAQGQQSDQVDFYQAYIGAQISMLEQKSGAALHHLPVLVSGMATSTIGMKELPYQTLPFKVDGSDLPVHVWEPSAQFLHQTILVSGVRTGDDVMRGEETLLVGCGVEDAEVEEVFIFPGTHSKHVWVQNGTAQLFTTYMTGEVFDLLSAKSILSNSVEKSKGGRDDSTAAFFEKGIREGVAANLLNSIFHVRTAHLFKKLEPAENYQYLSGLLIGTELKDLVQHPPPAICLVCGSSLEEQYRRGLTTLGLHGRLRTVNADAALIRGQHRVYEGVTAGRYALPGS